jgi:PAS domain S-box-containing protein
MTAGGASRDQELADLANRLAVAEESLRAVRAGEVDVIVKGAQGQEQIYTLETADRPYRHLVERMSEGAALADADGLILYANQRLATLLGVPLERVLGRSFPDWLDEAERPLFVQRLGTADPGGSEEQRLRRTDGGSVPVLVGVSVTQEPEGLLRCLIVTDLGPQKEQQEQLDRLNTELTASVAELHEVNQELEAERTRVELANAELQAANEAIQGFMAAAAHDLRSPLVSIAGFSALLTKSWETFGDQDRRKFVASIDRQAQIMSRLVDDLLTSSIIEGGGLTTASERLVLHAAIDRCLELGDRDTAGVSVSCPSDLTVQVDPQHLGRILDNYVQNAFKYGQPPVRIEATRRGDLVEVRVLDQGPGVPAEFVSRLFGRFARADTPSTRAEKGTGLGLSIVRGLAQANGGQARYEPNTPHGSCFVVQLPAGDTPAT